MAYTTNITNARKDLYKLAEMALDQGAEININTKKGNVVLISEEEYLGLLETIYLSQDPAFKKSIVDGLKTPYELTVAEDDVDWD